MAATVTPPISVPLRYDPSYKVDIRLHEPLLSHGITQLEVRVELFALCEQFEVICRHEVTEGSKPHSNKGSHVFHNKATVILDKMRQLLMKLPHIDISLEGYLESCEFDKLYPRLISYIRGTNSFSLAASPGNMEGYFSQMAVLHQVTSLAAQIKDDLRSKYNHKYIAHQLALLYQSLNTLADCPSLTPYKKSIEENFKPLKSSLVVNKDLNEPVLVDNMKQWLLEVTTNLSTIIEDFPCELTLPMTKPAVMLSRI